MNKLWIYYIVLYLYHSILFISFVPFDNIYTILVYNNNILCKWIKQIYYYIKKIRRILYMLNVIIMKNTI